MFNAHTINTPRFARKAATLAAVALAASGFAAAGPAHADTKSGSGTPKGCEIENNGKTETVAVGTRVGLFVCGEDGEWHFGWLITGINSTSPKTIKPVGSTPLRNGVLRVTRVAR